MYKFRLPALTASLLLVATTHAEEAPKPPQQPAAPQSLLDALNAARSGKAPTSPNPFTALPKPPADPNAAKPPIPAPTTAPAAPTPAPATPAVAPAPAVPVDVKPVDEWKPDPIRPGNQVSIKQPKLASGGGTTLRFDNADIYEVVQTVLGEVLNVPYVIEPGVTGKVNINSLTPVSAEDLFGVLQSVLALNGVSIVREGNVYKVIRDTLAPRDPGISGSSVGDNGAMIQIFAPRFVQPSAMIAPLKNFISPNAVLINDPTNRYLIISDRARNIRKLQELVEAFDIDYLARVQVEMIQIENGDATEVAKEMETLFKASQLYQWQGVEANKVFFMPIKRMNAILVGAQSREILESARRRIKEVDVVPKEGLGSRINIYTVKNSSAEHLASLISQIYGGAAIASSSSSSSSSSSTSGSGGTATRVIQKGPTPTTTATGSGLSGEVAIIPNDKTNSLIIKASRQDYLQILKLLDQLDVAPRQVLIQANIIEVTLEDSTKFGISWNLLNEGVRIDGKAFKAVAGFSQPLAKDAGGLVYNILSGKKDASGNDIFLATLQAAAGEGNVHLLSSPRLMASDGKDASIEIGDEVPVTTGQITNVGSTTSGSTTTNASNVLTESITYRQTGLSLKIKANINDSGLVNMNVSQKVSDVISGADTTRPRFSKREVETEVSVQEGSTFVIGGLIQEKRNDTEAGLPYLKDVPVLGNLFKQSSKIVKRTELFLTLTPYVVRNQDDAAHLSKEFESSLEEVTAFLKDMKLRQLSLPRQAALANPLPAPVVAPAPAPVVAPQPAPAPVPAAAPAPASAAKQPIKSFRER
ncbi:type II secretion system secretin GspD [Chitinimonas lacunae]|uniref:Type II secretion system secretin GspD n=1 Tax=Chitinimonas lacunae TaxID=1963018 RepID=A0ABV8MYI1_9NEIS